MSILDISIMAGEILLALDLNGGRIRLEALNPSRRCGRDVVLMAAGWLYKEGIVTVHPTMGDFVIAKARRKEEARP